MCFFKIIKTILNDRNYKICYKDPKNLDQIYLIDNWARNKTMKIKSLYEKTINLYNFFLFIIHQIHSEIISKVEIKGNKRISEKQLKFMEILF